MSSTINTLYGTFENSTLPYLSVYGVCNNTQYGVIPDPYALGTDHDLLQESGFRLLQENGSGILV